MKLKMVFCFFIFVFLTSCSHTLSPKQIPDIGLASVGKLQDNLSVDLINNEPNTTLKLFAAVGGHTYYANYNEWTQFFIKNYSNELSKRGVTVSTDSPNKIKLNISDFVFMQGFVKLRVNIKVHLESGDGKWSKLYEETDTSGLSMGRAFGSVIYHTIEKLLKDPEVIARMSL